jgi:hypothetical protein
VFLRRRLFRKLVPNLWDVYPSVNLKKLQLATEKTVLVIPFKIVHGYQKLSNVNTYRLKTGNQGGIVDELEALCVSDLCVCGSKFVKDRKLLQISSFLSFKIYWFGSLKIDFTDRSMAELNFTTITQDQIRCEDKEYHKTKIYLVRPESCA